MNQAEIILLFQGNLLLFLIANHFSMFFFFRSHNYSNSYKNRASWSLKESITGWYSIIVSTEYFKIKKIKCFF